MWLKQVQNSLYYFFILNAYFHACDPTNYFVSLFDFSRIVYVNLFDMSKQR